MASPELREIDIPQFMRVFGETAAAKATAMKEIMPAVSRIMQEVPKWAEMATEMAKK